MPSRKSSKNDLDLFMEEVRAESIAAGPEAEAELDAYLEHFELARQVIELRKSIGWTQKRLAARSGVQQSEISRIERGEGNPTYRTLKAIAKALRLELAFVKPDGIPAVLRIARKSVTTVR